MNAKHRTIQMSQTVSIRIIKKTLSSSNWYNWMNYENTARIYPIQFFFFSLRLLTIPFCKIKSQASINYEKSNKFILAACEPWPYHSCNVKCKELGNGAILTAQCSFRGQSGVNYINCYTCLHFKGYTELENCSYSINSISKNVC